MAISVPSLNEIYTAVEANTSEDNNKNKNNKQQQQILKSSLRSPRTLAEIYKARHFSSIASLASPKEAPSFDEKNNHHQELQDTGLHLSMQSADDDSQEHSSSEVTSNTSDDIIKRVEEEIANARKAAQEATKRLAGVSSDFWKKKQSRRPISPEGPRPCTAMSFDDIKDGETEKITKEKEPKSREDKIVSRNGSGSTTNTDVHFDMAIDVLSKKFDYDDDGLDEIDKYRSPMDAEEKKDDDDVVRCKDLPISYTISPDDAPEDEQASFKISSKSSSEAQHSSRNRSVEECTLDYDGPADESSKPLMYSKQEEKGSTSDLRAVISINQSTTAMDDVAVEELEAVLSESIIFHKVMSDETEGDVVEMNSENESHGSEEDSQESLQGNEQGDFDELGNATEDQSSQNVDEFIEISSEPAVSEKDEFEKDKYACLEANKSSVDKSQNDPTPEGDEATEEISQDLVREVAPEEEMETDPIDKPCEDLDTASQASIPEDRATDDRNQLTSQLDCNLSEIDESSPPNELKEETASSTFAPKAVSRGKKVHFKQKYPTPQQMKPFRNPSEIEFHYQAEKPTDKLWLSKPKNDLKELLQAVTGPSIQRRNNACGALKVLSTQKKNQLTLVRTEGFMDALVFAIGDNVSNEDAETGMSARTRAVNVILNVCAKKVNRHHVLQHPGLGDGLVKCMMEDKGEARELACACLANLAKSQHCREPMGKVEKLIDFLAVILKGDDPSVFEKNRRSKAGEQKNDYSGDDMSHAISNSHSSTSSSSTNSSFGDVDETIGTLKDYPEMRKRTRMNACAALMHLSKECSISRVLCGSSTLLFCLIACCKEIEHPLHTKCLEIVANLTRFPHNNARLVDYPGLLEALILNGSNDESDIDRLWSVRILQNISSESTARSKLAGIVILELLCARMMGSEYEEQLAATCTIYNISTEPGAVVPLTNTKNVVATLVHVAHSPKSIAEVRTIACDALATLGLWLQTLASAGTVPEDTSFVPLPSYVSSGWQRWDDETN